MSESNSNIQVTPENEAEILQLAEAAKAEAAGTVPKAEEVKADSEVSKETTETPKAGDKQTLKIPEKEVEKAEDAASDGLDLESYYAEYAEKGALSEESTSKIVDVLTAAKINNPEAVLAQYMAGAASQIAVMRSSAFEVTGGEEQYVKMVAWATENMSPGEISAFDQAVSDPNMIGLAVRGLFAQFQGATGNQQTPAAQGEQSPRVSAGVLSSKGHEPLNSQAQLADLVSDPRYMKDPGFRSTADARIRASMDAGLI